MRLSHSLLMGLAALAFTVQAQTTLTGIAGVPCPIPNPGVPTQVLCQKPDWCMTNIPVPPPAPFAGAAAYDDVLQAVWVSQGNLISVFAPRTGCPNPCQCFCRPLCKSPFQWPYPNSLVTGMAIDSLNRILWISDSLGWIRWYSIGGPCVIKPMSGCRIPLPKGAFITGLAFDKFTKTLFYVTGTFLPPTPGSTVVFAAPSKTPCRPFCKWSLKACPAGAFGPATGAAFDSCKTSLMVTDGAQTAVVSYTPPTPVTPCRFKLLSCCSARPVFYWGIGIRTSACVPFFGTSGRKTRTGWPCSMVCPNCATIPGYAGGLPQVGNPNFKLTLKQGPRPPKSKSLALLMINWGNRCKAQKIPMPCGSVLLYPLMDAMFWSTGAPVAVTPGNCGLSATFGLPLPVMPTLCCYKFCGQWAVLNVMPLGPTVRWCLTLSKQFSVGIGG